MLWLALYLPELALQSTVPADLDAPVALYESRSGRALVYAVNAAARRAGIEPGMTLASAQTLAGRLRGIERRIDGEAAALERLAHWAQQFTPAVSLQPPDGLLLEVAASLRLFGGIGALRQAVDAAMQPLGYSLRLGIAPTPAGAWLLALAGLDQIVTDTEGLRASIAEQPAHLLARSRQQADYLRAIGIETIGQCLQLPRSGLSQRLGPAFVASLDRLLGRAPDPREFYTPPPQFQSRIMLPDTVHEAASLLFVVQRLLHEMAGFLRARGAGAQRMRLGLLAPRLPAEYLELDLLMPSHDPAHLLKLWHEKLERHRLRHPIEGIELHVPTLAPMTPVALDLLATRRADTQDFTQFLERLQNRLGSAVIQQPVHGNAHRPEHAGRLCRYRAEPRDPTVTPHLAERPLWLLPIPKPLKLTPQGPWLDGPLRLLEGPERIESGWWDGQDQRRDYYVALSQRQQRLWIYREIGAASSWFLHGWFS